MASERYTLRMVWALAASIYFSTSGTYAECPTKSDDPAIDCTLPKTPCNPQGSYAQFPGYAPPGKNCGNGITSIVAGPIVLIISSMNTARTGPGSVTLSNKGFGRGVTAVESIVPTSSGYLIYDNSGAQTSFEAATAPGVYYSSRRLRGDVTELLPSSDGKEIVVRDRRSKAYVVYQKIGTSGSYLPVRRVAEDGFETILGYSASGIPTSIRDTRTNQRVAFTLKGEYVDTIKNADNVVTQLTYDKDGYLKEVIQADGKRTTLTYDSAGRHFVTMIANPDASFQTNSYFDNGVLAATSTGVQSRSTRGPVTTSFTMFSYTSDTVLTTERNPANAIAKRFARVEFTDVPGVGMLASKMYASDGAYSQKDNPGVLLSSSTFGAAGQLKRTYDRFGIGTEFFYTASADCTHASNDIPEMPIATCIRSVTGTTKITYNESLLPTRVTNLNSKGDTIQTVARSYNKVGMAERESVTNAQGVEVATVTTNYGSSGFYPTSSTSRSIQTAKYDNLYRLVEAGGNNGSLTTYSYDAAGRVRSVTTNGDTQSVNQSVSDGASATTVSDGVMTTTVHTSADGLGFGVTSQRVSPNAQIVPSLMGSWGGFTADQSARASFDISSLHRTDEENEPTAPQSEVGQLMPAEVIENFTLGAVINPSRGVTTTTNHHISSPDGALNDGSSQEELWPAVAMNPAKRSTKRSGNSGIGQRRERRSVGKVTLPAAKRK